MALPLLLTEMRPEFHYNNVGGRVRNMICRGRGGRGGRGGRAYSFAGANVVDGTVSRVIPLPEIEVVKEAVSRLIHHIQTSPISIHNENHNM